MSTSKLVYVEECPERMLIKDDLEKRSKLSSVNKSIKFEDKCQSHISSVIKDDSEESQVSSLKQFRKKSVKKNVKKTIGLCNDKSYIEDDHISFHYNVHGLLEKHKYKPFIAKKHNNKNENYIEKSQQQQDEKVCNPTNSKKQKSIWIDQSQSQNQADDLSKGSVITKKTLKYDHITTSRKRANFKHDPVENLDLKIDQIVNKKLSLLKKELDYTRNELKAQKREMALKRSVNSNPLKIKTKHKLDDFMEYCDSMISKGKSTKHKEKSTTDDNFKNSFMDCYSKN